MGDDETGRTSKSTRAFLREWGLLEGGIGAWRFARKKGGHILRVVVKMTQCWSLAES